MKAVRDIVLGVATGTCLLLGAALAVYALSARGKGPTVACGFLSGAAWAITSVGALAALRRRLDRSPLVTGRSVLAGVVVWILVSSGLISARLTTLERTTEGAMRHVTQGQLLLIRSALQAYAADFGTFPAEGEGLDVLIANSKTNYLHGLYDGPPVSDVWGNAYQYATNGQPSVWSKGPDAISGTPDDIY
jgi:hypothetical protein